FENSLNRLGVDRVNNVMLHTTDDITNFGDKAAKAMRSLIDRGYTDLIGASVYTYEDIEHVLEYPEYDSVQIPMSIFDQRLIRSGALEKLRKAGMTVFVRSVFLQGIFFLDPDTMTDPFFAEEVAPRIRNLREYADREGMSVAELAIAFIRDLPGVSSLVLGADNPDQVKANVRFFDTKAISEETVAALHRDFAEVDIPRIMQVLAQLYRERNKM
ncbi:MAG: aldo/keto reductase, partial [Clostridia bacterium]|nr:aldo/keto reductase [Clostridia bacterium]